MKRLSVNIPHELHKEAKVLAHLEDETLSSLVLRLLHGYIADQQASLNTTPMRNIAKPQSSAGRRMA